MKKSQEHPKDVPLEELLPICEDVLEKGGTFWVKFTCNFCGARQTSDTPNTIHTAGYTCEECKNLNRPVVYGLMVLFTPGRETLNG